MIRTALAALAALAVLVACNKPGTGRAGAVQTPPASATAAREEASRLLARGEYAAAEGQYRLALQQEPEDVAIRYGLGTVLSHLDRPEDTRQQFEWVVSHAERGREEFILAQQWLSRLAPPASSTETESASATAGTEETPTTAAAVVFGTMKGKTAWPGITAETQPTSLELRLVPEDAGKAGKTLKLHIRLGNPYVFSKIPAGAYQLVARAHGRELWKRGVVIAADTESIVDLTPDTSLLTPEQFSPRDSS
jgi:hypothetical protein